MSVKPLSGIALVDQYKIGGDYALAVNAQQALQGLEFADFDGIQVKRIVGSGMTITEQGALTIAGAAQTKGIRAKLGSNQMAATVTKDWWGQPSYHRTFSIGLYLPNDLLGGNMTRIFYRIKNQDDDNVFEFGKDVDDNLYFKLGNSTEVVSTNVEQGPDTYTPFAMDDTPMLFECGVCLTDTNYYFHYYGFGEVSAALPSWEYPSGSTTFTVDLLENCPGAILSYVRMLKCLRYPANNNTFTPLGKGNFPAKIAYYDFEEEGGTTLYDQSNDAIDLTLTDNGERVII